jgi:hypothetical protein
MMLARGMYARELKSINSAPVQVVPPQPKRPRITLNEMLHQSGASFKCSILKTNYSSCNCKYRRDWEDLKNAWLDYNEWRDTYGHIKNGVVEMPTVNMLPIYLAVPGWPVVGAGMFIKGGASNIPNYHEIERMERELKELDS